MADNSRGYKGGSPMSEEKIRLFLSYAHEDDRESDIVKKIIEYLDAEFEVFVDQRNIPHHADWRRALSKAINETDATLGLLSVYSAEERSVCLDELGISVSIPGRKMITALLDDEAQKHLPSTITRNQWVDFSRWREYIGTEEWDEYFQQRMESIVQAANDPENYEFQGQITKLCKILRPALDNKKYLSYIGDDTVCPRNWITEQIRSWLEDEKGERILALTGGAGTGKSHFAANFQHYNPQCAAGFYCDYTRNNNPDYTKEIFRTITFVLATKYPDFRYSLFMKLTSLGLILESGEISVGRVSEYFEKADAYQIFEELLCLNLIQGYNQKYVILIDGLDELSKGENNQLLDILCGDAVNRLSSHFRFIVTTRNEPMIMAAMNRTNVRKVDLDCEDSCGDIREYIKFRLKKVPGCDAGKYAEELADKCEYMFLYARMLCDEIECGAISIKDFINMPRGLGGLFYRYFERIFGHNDNYEYVKRFLRIIVAYNIGEIPEYILQNALGVNQEEIRKFYRFMGSFAEKHVTDGVSCVYLFHKSLYDWLTDSELSGKYFIDKEIGKGDMLAYCQAVMDTNGENMPFYMQRAVYRFVTKNGGKLRKEIPQAFAYTLQIGALENSDLELFKETNRRICIMSSDGDDKEYYLRSQNMKVAWLIDVIGDYSAASELLESLCTVIPEVINHNPCVYCEIVLQRIYAAKVIKKDACFAYDESVKIIDYLNAQSAVRLPGKLIMLTRAYYHKSMAEYDLMRYDQCLDTCDSAIEYAQIAYEDPDKMICLVKIIEGSCWLKKGQYEESISAFETALDIRRRLYGEYSLYTANSYNNLIKAMYRRALNTGEKCDSRAFEYLERYKGIVETVVGEKNKRMGIYYLHSAYLYGLLHERQAAEWACKYMQLCGESTTEKIRNDMQRIMDEAAKGED